MDSAFYPKSNQGGPDESSVTGQCFIEREQVPQHVSSPVQIRELEGTQFLSNHTTETRDERKSINIDDDACNGVPVVAGLDPPKDGAELRPPGGIEEVQSDKAAKESQATPLDAVARPYLCPFPAPVDEEMSSCTWTMHHTHAGMEITVAAQGIYKESCFTIEAGRPRWEGQRKARAKSQGFIESTLSAESIRRPEEAEDECDAAGTSSQLAAPVFAASPKLDSVAPMGRQGGRVFLHGNYHRYYGYRTGQTLESDPRLSMLQRHWFARRRCMDVGCNEGLITLAISSKFGSKSMIGVDLDEHLIARACRNLRESRSAAVDARRTARRAGASAEERRTSRVAMVSLAQTWFVHADFLEARYDAESVDTLTAFSVTKWIHLHRGDDGLRQFFDRVCALLSIGGFFILEPQPWRSYKTASRKVQHAGGKDILPKHGFFHRLKDLELRPERFPEILQEEYGLCLIKQVRISSADARGFERPIYLFTKKAA